MASAVTFDVQGKIEGNPQYWRCLPREANNVFKNAKVGVIDQNRILIVVLFS
jgi:hypothetical protein